MNKNTQPYPFLNTFFPYSHHPYQDYSKTPSSSSTTLVDTSTSSSLPQTVQSPQKLRKEKQQTKNRKHSYRPLTTAPSISLATLHKLHRTAHDAADALDADATIVNQTTQYCRATRFTSRPYRLKEPWPFYYSVKASEGILMVARYLFHLEEFVRGCVVFVKKWEEEKGKKEEEKSRDDDVLSSLTSVSIMSNVESMGVDGNGGVSAGCHDDDDVGRDADEKGDDEMTIVWVTTMLDDALTARLMLLVKEYYYRDYTQVESMHNIDGHSAFSKDDVQLLNDEVEMRREVAEQLVEKGRMLTAEQTRLVENAKREKKVVITGNGSGCIDEERRGDAEAAEALSELLKREMDIGFGLRGSRGNDVEWWRELMVERGISVQSRVGINRESILKLA